MTPPMMALMECAGGCGNFVQQLTGEPDKCRRCLAAEVQLLDRTLEAYARMPLPVAVATARAEAARTQIAKRIREQITHWRSTSDNYITYELEKLLEELGL